MKQGIFEVITNEQIAVNTYKLVLAGDADETVKAGTFVNIRLDGFYLRRPISVCNAENGKLTLIYKVVGKGTEKLSHEVPGAELDLLTELGNGYDLAASGDRPLLLGGGAGVPPMYLLCRRLVAKGKKVTACLGFNTRSEVFFEREFLDLGAEVLISTADGSYGKKGYVTDILPDSYSYFYACGPEPMLKAVYRATVTSGEFSFEERMGCGFGACMGCSCKTLTGYKRICKDGPVLKKEEILWDK